MPDIDTRLREALHSAPEDPPGAGDHPPDLRLVAYAEGSMPHEEAEEIRDHLATCADCSEMLIDLAAFEAAVVTPELAEDADGHTEGQLRSWWAAARDWLFGGGAVALPRSAAALAVAAMVALATVAVVLFLTPGAPLPFYTAELGGGVATHRDGSDRLYPPGSRLEIVLRPQDAVEGDLEVRAWRLGEDGPQVLDVPVESSRRGIVRLSGRVGEEVDLLPGVNRLLVVVARPGRAPEVERLASELAGAAEARADEWAAWRIDVTVGEGG